MVYAAGLSLCGSCTTTCLIANQSKILLINFPCIVSPPGLVDWLELQKQAGAIPAGELAAYVMTHDGRHHPAAILPGHPKWAAAVAAVAAKAPQHAGRRPRSRGGRAATAAGSCSRTAATAGDGRGHRRHASPSAHMFIRNSSHSRERDLPAVMAGGSDGGGTTITRAVAHKGTRNFDQNIIRDGGGGAGASSSYGERGYRGGDLSATTAHRGLPAAGAARGYLPAPGDADGDGGDDLTGDVLAGVLQPGSPNRITGELFDNVDRDHEEAADQDAPVMSHSSHQPCKGAGHKAAGSAGGHPHHHQGGRGGGRGGAGHWSAHGHDFDDMDESTK